jgi:hypothetical protein
VFTVTYNKGFYLPLPNGYKVSIQIGAGDYCDNYHSEIGGERKDNFTRSTTAETAIIGEDGGFVQWRDDAVQAYQTIKQVWETIQYAASLPTTQQPKKSEMEKTLRDEFAMAVIPTIACTYDTWAQVIKKAYEIADIAMKTRETKEKE